MTKEQVITQIIVTMEHHLDKEQMSILRNAVTMALFNVDIVARKNELSTELDDNYSIINKFLACKKINGILDTTLNCYKYTAIKFFDWANVNYKNVDTNTIRAYLLYNQKQGVGMVSCDNLRRNLNSFFEWLFQEDYIPKNPCKKITRLKEPKCIRKKYTDMDMEKLRDSCKTKRELALIDLLLCTGIRVGEIGKIKLSDIDFSTDTIIINGKGNKQREVYMAARAKKHIQEYLSERRTNGIDSEYLFCRDKKPYDKQLNVGSCNKIFKQVAERAGLNECTVHCIRRYVATSLSLKGIPVNTISLLLGHAGTTITTRYYILPSANKTRDVILGAM